MVLTTSRGIIRLLFLLPLLLLLLLLLPAPPPITQPCNRPLLCTAKVVPLSHPIAPSPPPPLKQDLVAEAGRVGLPLNVICLNAAMSVLARSGRWYEALDLLAKMRRGAPLRDVGVADSEQARSPWKHPPAEREGEGAGAEQPVLFLPKPDTITFNAAISGESDPVLMGMVLLLSGAECVCVCFFLVFDVLCCLLTSPCRVWFFGCLLGYVGAVPEVYSTFTHTYVVFLNRAARCVQ